MAIKKEANGYLREEAKVFSLRKLSARAQVQFPIWAISGLFCVFFLLPCVVEHPPMINLYARDFGFLGVLSLGK